MAIPRNLANFANTLNSSGQAPAAGSSGQVQYNSSGVFGGSANFFWDNGNARLGIGTSSPTVALDVRFGGVAALFTATNSNANQIGFSNAANAAAGFYMGSPSQGALQFSDHNGIERMRITSGGQLLVGTATDPGGLGARVAIDHTGTNYALMLNTTTSAAPNIVHFRNSNANGEARLQNNTGGPLTFWYNNSTEAARITTSGNFLIGATSSSAMSGSPAPFLHVGESYSNTSPSNGASIQVNCIGNGSVYSYVSNITYFNHFLFNWRGTTAGSISSPNAASVAYNTSSDYRMKDNVQTMTGALDKVMALRPVTWTWKEEFGAQDGEGFIAHELQAVCPAAVSGEKDAVDEEGKPKYQGVDTSFLVATLTAAIQELKAQNDELRQRVAALEQSAK